MGFFYEQLTLQTTCVCRKFEFFGGSFATKPEMFVLMTHENYLQWIRSI